MPMKRPVVVPAVPRRNFFDLQCPECTGLVRVARDELVEGGAVQCRHCGTEAEITQEADFDGRTRWILIDPLADYGDEERRVS
jgi:predicted Zn finger-like uncharacterized protein